MVDTNILSVIIKVIVIIDDDSLMAIDVLNHSEWVKLDLIADVVLSTDQDTIVKDLDEVL